jgi:hypothetical protein
MSYQSVGSARFDDARALTEDELRKYVPSIFATTAHESRSSRFVPIPTIDVVRALDKEGFHVVHAVQCHSRSQSKQLFTKHLLRIRRLDQQVRVGDTVFEINMKNGNDGSSVYDFFAGLFRTLCLNSMVANESTLASVKVRHTGHIIPQVIEGTYTVLKQAEKALEAPRKWSGINLLPDARLAFAEKARVIRFGDKDGVVNTPISAEQLLHPRRSGDVEHDLWTTFNVVQENALRGGLVAFGRDSANRFRQFTSRPVKGIDQDLKVNRDLWQLAHETAEALI